LPDESNNPREVLPSAEKEEEEKLRSSKGWSRYHLQKLGVRFYAKSRFDLNVPLSNACVSSLSWLTDRLANRATFLLGTETIKSKSDGGLTIHYIEKRRTLRWELNDASGACSVLSIEVQLRSFLVNIRRNINMQPTEVTLISHTNVQAKSFVRC
jgi:hypothetical protein